MKQVRMTKNIVAFDADRKIGLIVSVDLQLFLHLLNLCIYNNWCLYYDRVADDIIITQLMKNKRRGRNKK